MGWVSYLEDVCDRLNQDRDELGSTTARPGESVDIRKEQAALLRSLDAVIGNVHEVLELATDPEMELAHEVRELIERDKHQRATITRLQEERDDLASKLQQFDGQTDELRQCKQELDSLLKERLRARFGRESTTKWGRRAKPRA